jgi:thiamine-monophosphate kinase
MIDVSDGLTQDLARICEESAAAAIIDFDSVSVAKEVGLVSKEPEAAFDFAVRGGEDFELLLTASGDDDSELFETAASCGLRLSRIGEIVPARLTPPSLMLRRAGEVKPLSIHGWDHFQI